MPIPSATFAKRRAVTPTAKRFSSEGLASQAWLPGRQSYSRVDCIEGAPTGCGFSRDWAMRGSIPGRAPPSAAEAGLCNAIEGPIAAREPCAYLELEDTMCDDAGSEVHGREKDWLSARPSKEEAAEAAPSFAGIPLKKRITESVR
jgi:hypothetical protein